MVVERLAAGRRAATACRATDAPQQEAIEAPAQAVLHPTKLQVQAHTLAPLKGPSPHPHLRYMQGSAHRVQHAADAHSPITSNPTACLTIPAAAWFNAPNQSWNETTSPPAAPPSGPTALGLSVPYSHHGKMLVCGWVDAPKIVASGRCGSCKTAVLQVCHDYLRRVSCAPPPAAFLRYPPLESYSAAVPPAPAGSTSPHARHAPKQQQAVSHRYNPITSI
jgi:hypothetical protein